MTDSEVDLLAAMTSLRQFQTPGTFDFRCVVSAALSLGRLHMTLSKFEDAAADFAQAEKAARACRDQENEVKAICYYASAQLLLRRLGETVQQGQRALQLARSTGSGVCVASAQLVLANERLCAGALAAAEDYFDRAVPVLKREGSPIQTVDAAASAGSIHTWRLEYHKAHRIFDSTVQKSRELGACFLRLRFSSSRA